VHRVNLMLARRAVAAPAAARLAASYYSSSSSSSSSSGGRSNRRSYAAWSSVALLGAVTAAAAIVVSQKREERVALAAEAKSVNWDVLREDIVKILENDKYDDGSYGPVFVRLAWHACGTYEKASNTGGSDGATMRYEPEAKHGANAGLAVARGLLEEVKKKHPNVTYADLWQFAAVVAIQEMKGPKIPFRPGRLDKDDAKHCPPDGRLPDADKGAQHIRDVFYRMGFNDQEIVALLGAHALGRCHTDRSGYEGPWTNSPTVFTNDFFHQLLENKWTKRDWKGPPQFQDPSGALMMLPSDMALVDDEKFKVWVTKYRDDEGLFFRDFASAFKKLQELGVRAFSESTIVKPDAKHDAKHDAPAATAATARSPAGRTPARRSGSRACRRPCSTDS